MHLDHALAGAAEFFRHHGPDEAVVRDPLIECVRIFVLLGAFHPVFAVELLRDGVAIFEDLALLMCEIEIHALTPSRARSHRAGDYAFLTRDKVTYSVILS